MATGTTEFVDNTTADVFIPEIWSGKALVARQAQLVFAKLVDTQYKEELRFGDTIHVPSVGNLASRSKSANTAITFETITETNTDITVSTHDYAAMAVESITKVQANRDLMATYSGKLGYALALAIDDVLAGYPDNFSQFVGTLAVGLTYQDLLRARQYLDDAEAPEDGRVIVVSPAEEANFLQMDHFINKDYITAGGSTQTSDLSRGFIGNWMGMPVHKSTNVEGTNVGGHDNAMFQKEALTLVVQMEPKIETMRDIDYLCDKVAIQQLHGSREMRDDHGVWLKGA
jgi:N4-gp56 family major capsid protein